jgi:hypothetical protein
MPTMHLTSAANVDMANNLTAIKNKVTGGLAKSRKNPVNYTFVGMNSMACWNFALFGSQELHNISNELVTPLIVDTQAAYTQLHQTYSRPDDRIQNKMVKMNYIRPDYSKVYRPSSALKTPVIKAKTIQELKKTFKAALKERDDRTKFATNQAKYHRLYTEIHAELAGWEISRKKPSRSGWLKIRCMSREWTSWHHWCLVWKKNVPFKKAYHWYAESFPTMTSAQCGMDTCNDYDFPYTEIYAIRCPQATWDAFNRFT